MRVQSTLAMALSAGLLVGCATGLNSGFNSSGLNGSGRGGGDALQRPGMRGDGIYVPTLEEQSFDCQQLAFVAGKSIQQINALPALAQKQSDAPPASVERAFARLSGGGLPALEDHNRERAHVRTLGQLMTQKSCPPLDIEAQIKSTEDKIAAFGSR